MLFFKFQKEVLILFQFQKDLESFKLIAKRNLVSFTNHLWLQFGKFRNKHLLWQHVFRNNVESINLSFPLKLYHHESEKWFQTIDSGKVIKQFKALNRVFHYHHGWSNQYYKNWDESRLKPNKSLSHLEIIILSFAILCFPNGIFENDLICSVFQSFTQNICLFFFNTTQERCF